MEWIVWVSILILAVVAVVFLYDRCLNKDVEIAELKLDLAKIRGAVDIYIDNMTTINRDYTNNILGIRMKFFRQSLKNIKETAREGQTYHTLLIIDEVSKGLDKLENQVEKKLEAKRTESGLERA